MHLQFNHPANRCILYPPQYNTAYFTGTAVFCSFAAFYIWKKKKPWKIKFNVGYFRILFFINRLRRKQNYSIAFCSDQYVYLLSHNISLVLLSRFLYMSVEFYNLLGILAEHLIQIILSLISILLPHAPYHFIHLFS